MLVQDRDAFPDASRQRERAARNGDSAAFDSGSSEWVPSGLQPAPQRLQAGRGGWGRLLTVALFAIIVIAALLLVWAHFMLRG